MNVFFIPTFSEENEYLANITAGLKHNCLNIVSEKKHNKRTAPIESIWNAVIHKNYVVHFNWIENKVSGKLAKINFIIIRIWVGLLRLFGAKICWTMHNKIPHADSRESLITEFYHYFLKQCDMVMVHCKESSDILRMNYGYQGKILNVPHGSYLHRESDEMVNFDNIKKMNFLYFGAVSRYKNIPVLIKAFKEVIKIEPNAKLNICGKCKDDHLNHEILESIGDCANIIYINKFLTEEELKHALDECCAVILPYDKTSMLNSGSAIMAFSNGRSVIIPDFGYMKDLCDKEFVLAYDYDTVEEHIEALAKILKESIQTEKLVVKFWENLGYQSYKFAKESLDWNVICADIARAYQEL